MREQGITLLEAMRFSMNPQKLLGDAALEVAGISHGQWLQTVLAQLRRPETMAKVKTSRGFTGQPAALSAGWSELALLSAPDETWRLPGR